jgi:hypothetical protein
MPSMTPSSQATVCDYQVIASCESIIQILDHWFELVHPVAPILHRDSFMRTFNDTDTPASWEFSALVISICAATVAALRRTTSLLASAVTVEKCCSILLGIEQLKGTYPLSLIRCQIKYNLSVSIAQERGLDAPESQLLMAEASSMVSRMLHYEEHTSLVDYELTKRLFWLCFAANCTAGLHSRPYTIPSLIYSKPESVTPADLCDANLAPITPGEANWHGNTTSYIPGLDALRKVFLLWHRSQQGDCSDLNHLRIYVDLASSVLDDLPPPLRWRGGLSRPARSNFGTDVQMVNLMITQLHIRSFLMDQMYRVASASGDDAVTEEIKASRRLLIDDMLAIVYQMPEATLEANGFSLVGKLRDIGISLLDDDNDPSIAFANLDRLLAKLNRLDTHRSSDMLSASPGTNSASPGSLLHAPAETFSNAGFSPEDYMR